MNRPRSFNKSEDELRRNFLHAFDALTLSAKSYDEGYYGEAVRLAATVHVFVHDHGKSSVSLLTHLKRKSIAFVSTAVPLNPRNLLTEMPLVMMRLSSDQPSVFYVPRLDDGPPIGRSEEPFHKWWDAGVMRDNRRRIFSRKNLISNMRHREGGAHVDGQLDEMFADLGRNNSMGWVGISAGEKFVPAYGPEYASVRQIAHELTLTLRAYCADLLPPA
jgi:hypothetical protein